MTAQPSHVSPGGASSGLRINLTTATIALALTILVQFAIVVATSARVQAQVTDLRATTEPLRRGDLVAIQRDVAWIRENMERDRPRAEAVR